MYKLYYKRKCTSWIIKGNVPEMKYQISLDLYLANIVVLHAQLFSQYVEDEDLSKIFLTMFQVFFFFQTLFPEQSFVFPRWKLKLQMISIRKTQTMDERLGLFRNKKTLKHFFSLTTRTNWKKDAFFLNEWFLEQTF